ncbi:uncharacterized protein LOC110774388 [Prunus avium]|uniref:Uncharacterized protein LOC110774388 n=1 Tax=Prunus avium TaxID=42229 RepID=A0A6P5U5I8_PRUAV|nr:uncharacterized protein LOC110774388 [Prunus avium]
MGKQTKAKKSENLGKGKVTPVQIAFIVDRYLCDNNYSETRSVFRNEASSLIAKSPIREAPKSLLSLAEILNEYICLKEQKVILDQEKVRVEQEKTRVQTLLKGMQGVMNTYNASGNPAAISTAGPASAPKPMLMASHLNPSNGSPAGFPMYQTPVAHPVSTPSNTNMGPGNFCSPITIDPPATKRKCSRVSVDAPSASKRSCNGLPTGKVPNKGAETVSASANALINQESAQPSSAVQSSLPNLVPNGSFAHGSTVAKCLFNQPSPSVPNNSTGPRTPPRAISSQIDKSVSPFEISSTATCSNNNSPPEITPNCCTIFSSKRVTLSPNKACYTVETNHCISSSPAKTSKRDHVKGRLNFDCSDVPMSLDQPISDDISTSESEKEVDPFDIDLPNFDAIGVDFSFTEMLGEFDLHCEELGYASQPNVGASMGTVSGSSYDNETADGNVGANQVMSEFSSTVTEVLSEKEMNVQGSDSLTAVKSVTKCIRIISPVKNRRSSQV